MLNSMTTLLAARRLVGAPALLALAFLIGCTPAATPTPTPNSSPTTPPTPSPSPSPTPSPTVSGINHSTDPAAVVLRMEQGGGLMPMEFLTTAAPDFTLYGDGTVIYRPADTRANDPLGGQGMLPYKVGHLDEEGVQALLRFALGEGRLLNAKAHYENNTLADAGTVTFTLNAADLSKVVSIYGLGNEDDPNLPQDALDRRGFEALVNQLGTFEARGNNGELGAVTDYDPAFYRVFLLGANDGVPQNPAIDWPWDELTVTDFQPTADDTRPRANLTKAQVSEVETVPTGGRSFIYVKGTQPDQLYTVGIRPLFPDDLKAEGLG
jgi:hypothetical protein